MRRVVGLRITTMCLVSLGCELLRRRSMSRTPDLRGVLIAVGVSGFVHRLVSFFFCRPPALLHHIPRPPGLVGFLFRHIFEASRTSFGVRQLKWLGETMAARGPTATVYSVEIVTAQFRIIAAHPRDLEYILLDHSSNFVKGPDYERLEPIIGAENLVTLRDEAVHAVARKLINPAFSPSILKRIAETVYTKQIDHYLTALEKQRSAQPNAPVELHRYFDDTTLSIVAEAAFKQLDFAGTDVQAEFRGVLSSLGIITFFLGPRVMRYAPFPRFSAMRRSVNRIRVAGSHILARVRQQSAAHTDAKEAGGESNEQSLVDYLVKEERLSESALLDHIVTFLFAGHETTSKSLLWTAYLLAAHPEVQAHLFEELSSAVPRSAVATLDSVKDLPYLNQVLKESLRLYPAIPAVLRHSVKDDVLPYSKAYIPANHVVAVHIFLSHRLESTYGPDCSEFKPERWNKELGLEERLGRCGWLPFIAGKRNCIGKAFAWNELTMVLATLMRRYELSLPPNYPEPKRKFNISMQPVDPIPFTLSPRE